MLPFICNLHGQADHSRPYVKTEQAVSFILIHIDTVLWQIYRVFKKELYNFETGCKFI
jgi:hypothetical protein